jgi:hypothetical protein
MRLITSGCTARRAWSTLLRDRRLPDLSPASALADPSLGRDDDSDGAGSDRQLGIDPEEEGQDRHEEDATAEPEQRSEDAAAIEAGRRKSAPRFNRRIAQSYEHHAGARPSNTPVIVGLSSTADKHTNQKHSLGYKKPTETTEISPLSKSGTTGGRTGFSQSSSAKVPRQQG